jgi:hypothetical protein
MNPSTDILKQFENIEEVLREFNELVKENRKKKIQ